MIVGFGDAERVVKFLGTPPATGPGDATVPAGSDCPMLGVIE
jgi:hypothetical protein